MKKKQYPLIVLATAFAELHATMPKKEQLLIPHTMPHESPKKVNVQPQLSNKTLLEDQWPKLKEKDKKHDIKLIKEEKIEIKKTGTTKHPAQTSINKQIHDQKNPRIVTIAKSITEKMITYTGHWYKPSPSIFHVSINDQEFVMLNKKGKMEVQNKQFALLEGKRLKARYEWTFEKFGKQWHSEEKEIEFEIPDQLDELEIGFAFDTDYRISIPQARHIAWRNVKPPQTTR
jgi:hypothetical protein